MEKRIEHILWCERYRPHTIEDAILPSEIKKAFQTYVDQKTVGNLLLAGPPGVGKTTAARAMLDEIGADYMVKNASLEGIDMLRTDIQQFASSVSILGGRKYVILDEADRLTRPTQEGLRAFMEEFASNCGFIFTANQKQQIIEPLHSRCAVIDFRIPKGERGDMAVKFYGRVVKILEENGVTFDKKAVLSLIQKHFPDWRRVLNELQHYSKCGKIDAGILSSFSDVTMRDLLSNVRQKSFTNVRKMLAENPDIDFLRFHRMLYDTAYDYFDPKFVPQVVVMIGESLDELGRSLDPEICIMKFLTILMIEAQWRAVGNLKEQL